MHLLLYYHGLLFQEVQAPPTLSPKSKTINNGDTFWHTLTTAESTATAEVNSQPLITISGTFNSADLTADDEILLSADTTCDVAAAVS